MCFKRNSKDLSVQVTSEKPLTHGWRQQEIFSICKIEIKHQVMTDCDFKHPFQAWAPSTRSWVFLTASKRSKNMCVSVCIQRGERENRRNTCFMEWGGVGSFSRFWTIKAALGSRTLSLLPKPLFPWLNEYISAKGQEFPLKPVINHYNCLCFQKWKCP